MTIAPESDPRTEPAIAAERDVRPIVEKPRAGLSGWAIGLISLAAALVLFLILNAHRQASTAPATAIPPMEDVAAASTPATLYIPPVPEPSPPAPLPTTVATQPEPAPSPSPSPAPQPVITQPQPQQAAQPAPSRNLAGPALVVDNGVNAAPVTAAPGPSGSSAAADGPADLVDTARVHAGMLASRTMTVPQGTLVSAILESALDSSKSGFARALVQRDVRGFDGTKVLIPRGSRLIGQFKGEVAQGQNRAFILWTRLIRPDGVTIAIGSPVADPVGRGGVRAHVNSHFFARFTGAILQSVLNVGVNLASRSSRSPVVVALPGSLQGATGAIAQPTDISPTLTVKPGTSISIFVARDLDFTGAADGRDGGEP